MASPISTPGLSHDPSPGRLHDLPVFSLASTPSASSDTLETRYERSLKSCQQARETLVTAKATHDRFKTEASRKQQQAAAEASRVAHGTFYYLEGRVLVKLESCED
jgi:hypothetical protein